MSVKTGLDLAIKNRLNLLSKKQTQEMQSCLGEVVCECECVQVMCSVSLETWGRVCSCPESSETSAGLSILSKIIEKKGCNSQCPGDWPGRDGRVSSVFSSCAGGRGRGQVERRQSGHWAQPGPGQHSYLWLLDLRGRLRTALACSELCVSHLNQPRCSDNQRNRR